MYLKNAIKFICEGFKAKIFMNEVFVKKVEIDNIFRIQVKISTFVQFQLKNDKNNLNVNKKNYFFFGVKKMEFEQEVRV